MAASKWQPVDLTEFAQTKSSIDPEAGAEIIFSDTEMANDEYYFTYVTRYVRVRIYGERGIEKYAKIGIPFAGGNKIRGVAARTITPDGRIAELDPKDVFDREVLKSGNVRVKEKSFAPPGLVPNCIVEYRYEEDRNEPLFRVIMGFHQPVPSRVVRYKVRLQHFIQFSVTHACLSFNCPPQELKVDKRGYYRFELKNIPATREEPYSPPDINTQPVVVLYVTLRTEMDPKIYWKEEAASLHEKLNAEAGNARIVRTTLSTICGPDDDMETKLHKIYEYCRTKILNRGRESSGFTSEQKKKFKDNEDAAETLKQGNGWGYDINVVFAALARAAGADVRLALCNDRRWMLYAPNVGAPFMMTDTVVAIREGTGWRFFDPGSTYLPFAQLGWQNSDTMCLVSNPKAVELVEIAGAPASFSTRRRVGKFALDTDGTIEGDVVTTYAGFFAAELRMDFDEQTADAREKTIRERIQTTLKLAEVTDVVVENATDPEKELTIKYHLRVPEYAEHTGSRMFFQPAVFQKNLQPLFDSATRDNSIIFHFRQVEHDEISIQPPTGFTLEAASNPGELDLGNFGKYTTVTSYKKKSGLITYKRTSTQNGLLVPKNAYDSLKAAYDSIHAKDNHVFTLKKSATPVAATTGEAPAAPSPGALSAEPAGAP